MCRDQDIVSTSMMDQTINYKPRVSPYINGYGPQITCMLILLTSQYPIIKEDLRAAFYFGRQNHKTPKIDLPMENSGMLPLLFDWYT